ncbi:MAG: ATP-binding protein [Rhodanobacter sp.]
MTEILQARANPEKRLFVSLITRDITLADAILDVLDNSLNAALEPIAHDLVSADDYVQLLSGAREPAVEIRVDISPDQISIQDNASGISAEVARDHVFRFGKPEGEADPNDRLSVYGIGLKRAMFKIARKVVMTSEHALGGFRLDLDVDEWQARREDVWTFDIETRNPAEGQTGTALTLTELRPEVRKRVDDPVFLDQLKVKVARAYAFFLDRIVSVYINGDRIGGISLKMGGNVASEGFSEGSVSCTVTAGLAAPEKGERYSQESSGWFVFCNGRTVVYADKSQLTGWGDGSALPVFQPKHRPFVGVVFFVSSDPEALPWTTTKTGVNEESSVWQTARRLMVVVGRQVTTFLDRRYTSDGTEVALDDVKEAAGEVKSVLDVSRLSKKAFATPTKVAPEEIKIQYFARVAHVEAIAKYLRRSNMSGAKVGQYTFEYFYKNRVAVDE